MFVALLVSCHAFVTHKSFLVTPVPTQTTRSITSSLTILAAEDPSRSGTKRDRLDRLAELEDERLETDKSFVVQAAGIFVVLLLALLAAAASSGLLETY